MSEYIWCLALHMLDYDLIAVIPMKNTHKQIKQNIATTTTKNDNNHHRNCNITIYCNTNPTLYFV